MCWKYIFLFIRVLHVHKERHVAIEFVISTEIVVSCFSVLPPSLWGFIQRKRSNPLIHQIVHSRKIYIQMRKKGKQTRSSVDGEMEIHPKNCSSVSHKSISEPLQRRRATRFYSISFPHLQKKKDEEEEVSLHFLWNLTPLRLCTSQVTLCNVCHVNLRPSIPQQGSLY